MHGAGVVLLRISFFDGLRRSSPAILLVERAELFPRVHLYDHAAVFDVFVFVDAVVADDGFPRFVPVLEESRVF